MVYSVKWCDITADLAISRAATSQDTDRLDGIVAL